MWNFFGEIIHAAANYPRSWHDTKLASVSGLYFPKLSDEMTPPGMAILGDSAFVNTTKAMNSKIVRGRKTNEVHDVPISAALAAVDILVQRAMPSERQSAEWGVRAIKAPFQRLKTPLPANSRKHLRLLRICFHLFNFRTQYVGLNQIRTTYGRVQEHYVPCYLFGDCPHSDIRCCLPSDASLLPHLAATCHSRRIYRGAAYPADARTAQCDGEPF